MIFSSNSSFQDWHMMRWFNVFALIGFLCTSASGQSSPTIESSKAGVESAVRHHLDGYINAFNDRDFQQLESLLGESVIYQDVSMDLVTEGRENLIQQIKDAVDESDLKLSATIDAIGFTDPAVVSVTGTNQLIVEGGEALEFLFSLQLRHDAGNWTITKIIEEATEQDDPATSRLEELAWLEGTWTDTNDDQITSQIRSMPGRNFLIRAFRRGGQSEGFQVIGYDRASDAIRSWSYFADGTYGEGIWDIDEDVIRIKSQQQLAGGGQAGGTYVLRRLSEDQLMIKLVGHEINGEPVPKAMSVTAQRQTVDRTTTTTDEVQP
ncbi:MAG: hypothetical protein AAGC97_18790 [Planctomycetota bacterium]